MIDRWVFQFLVDDGRIHLYDGRADDPAVTWATDEETWSQIASGMLTPSAAIDAGARTVQGDAKAARRFTKVFSRHGMFARTGRRSGLSGLASGYGATPTTEGGSVTPRMMTVHVCWLSSTAGHPLLSLGALPA